MVPSPKREGGLGTLVPSPKREKGLGPVPSPRGGGLRRGGRRAVKRGRQPGQATFEFVLLLPVYVAFLLLLVDFGLLTYHFIAISNAVREGARYAAVNCNDGSCDEFDVRQRAIRGAGGVLHPVADAAKVHVNWYDRGSNGSKPGRGDSAVVSIDYPYVFQFIPGATITVHSCADMRLERADTGSLVQGYKDC